MRAFFVAATSKEYRCTLYYCTRPVWQTTVCIYTISQGGPNGLRRTEDGRTFLFRRDDCSSASNDHPLQISSGAQCAVVYRRSDEDPKDWDRIIAAIEETNGVHVTTQDDGSTHIS
nr:DUF1654 domain-containing protein [Pseudomonas viridiflava]